MKDKIFGNLFWKLLSLGLAFLLWLVVMNVINPSSNQSVSGVKVSLENIAYVESMGMTCRLADSSDEVSVTVRGRRRTVERLRAADITAIADMRQIIDISSTPVLVPVTVSVPGISSENISVTPRNIEVVLEEIGSKDFVINPVVTAGTLPSVGYQVGTLSVSPEKVNVRGPESVISKIDKINAEVNVSGIAVDKDLTASIHIIDRNGEELPAVERDALKFDKDMTTVMVHVQLDEVLEDVPVSAEVWGSPAEGYQVGNVTVTPSVIGVAGTPEAVSRFANEGGTLMITQDSEKVDVSGRNADFDVSVNITDFLPEGLKLEDGFTSQVVVSVEILPNRSRAYTFSSQNIRKKNLGEDLSAAFSVKEIRIVVRASDKRLDALTADQIEASVDLAGMEEGTYSDVPVEITLPSGYQLTESPSVSMEIIRNSG